MSQRLHSGTSKNRRGFTLIEIMAVVAIIAMVFAIGVPRLGGKSWDTLNTETEFIAQSLRFARQRAVMTGVPHRLLIDLEDGGYLIEWYVTENGALGESDDDSDTSGSSGFPLNLSDSDSTSSDETPILDFTPPPRAERDFFPIPHPRMGTMRWLDDALYFVGIEGETGWVESGDYGIVFYVDGTTDSASLEIADSDDNHITLEIEPIRENVFVRKGGARR